MNTGTQEMETEEMKATEKIEQWREVARCSVPVRLAKAMCRTASTDTARQAIMVVKVRPWGPLALLSATNGRVLLDYKPGDWEDNPDAEASPCEFLVPAAAFAKAMVGAKKDGEVELSLFRRDCGVTTQERVEVTVYTSKRQFGSSVIFLETPAAEFPSFRSVYKMIPRVPDSEKECGLWEPCWGSEILGWAADVAKLLGTGYNNPVTFYQAEPEKDKHGNLVLSRPAVVTFGRNWPTLVGLMMPVLGSEQSAIPMWARKEIGNAYE